MSLPRHSALSFICFFFLFCSCSQEIEEEVAEILPHINICVLGNSYSNDSFSYVPFILKQQRITCCIHIYSRSSGSLRDLDTEWEKGYASATHYTIDTRYDKKWRTSTVLSAERMLSLQVWDMVSIQQASRQVEVEGSYSPYLDNVIGRISKICSYPFDLAWFMAYNRADDDANDVNLSVQRRIVERSCFDIVFPVATAIFNCQANPQLARLGDSIYGKMYAEDNVHLQEGLPCYVAALSISEAILRRIDPSNTILGDRIRPTQQWIESVGGIAPNGPSVGVNEENCNLAQKAAVCANDYLFEIIPVE